MPETTIFEDMVKALAKDSRFDLLDHAAIRAQVASVCATVAENRTARLREQHERMVELLGNMESQHVTFGMLDSDEVLHPDWCRECRVTKLQEALAALEGYLTAYHPMDPQPDSTAAWAIAALGEQSMEITDLKAVLLKLLDATVFVRREFEAEGGWKVEALNEAREALA